MYVYLSILIMSLMSLL